MELQERMPKEIAALALTHLNSMKLPNMPTPLHCPTLAEEYAMPANCNVLIGEDSIGISRK